MKNSERLLRIGAGASFADDRIAPAVDLAERGELDYLVFECLAERTVARENLTRMKDPEKGYTPRLLDRMGAVLPACLRNGVRIVSIGMSSVHGMGEGRPEPYEVRMRLATRTTDRKAAEAVGFEVRALHVNGPGGGGGGSDPVVREILAVQSVLLPRAVVDCQVEVDRI